MPLPLIGGLDPGATGGLGLLSIDGAFQAAFPLPETEREIHDLLAEHAPQIERMYLEAVHSFPHQGVKSTFTFGRNYGVLRGLLIALKVPFEDIRPEKWTKALGLKKTGRGRPTKQLHKGICQHWFPKLQVTSATADALLIAEYGRRQAAPPPLLNGVELQHVG